MSRPPLNQEIIQNIRKLRSNGVEIIEIAETLKLDRKTVAKYANLPRSVHHVNLVLKRPSWFIDEQFIQKLMSGR